MKVWSKKNKEKWIELLWISPLLVVLGLIPLLVRLRMVTLTPIERILYNINETVSYDFFNKVKSEWLIVCASVAMILLLVRVLRRDVKIEFKWFMVPVLSYAGLVILSASMARYRDVFIENYSGIINNPEEVAHASNMALTGFIEQYESLYVLLSYVVLFFVTYFLVETAFQKKVIIGTILGSAALMSVIALLQYYGISDFESDHWKRVMLGPAYENLKNSINYTLGNYYSVGTLYNPNYLGGYMAMVVMLALGVFYGAEGKARLVMAYGVLMLVFAGLMSSNSSTGILAAAVGLVSFIALLLIKKTLPLRKCLLSLLGFVVVIGLLNITSSKRIDAELGSLGDELEMVTGMYENSRDKILTLEYVDRGLRIVSTAGEMTLRSVDGHIQVLDGEQGPLEIELDGKKWLIKDPAYKEIHIEYLSDAGGILWAVGSSRIYLQVLPESIKVIGLGALPFPVDKEVPSFGFEGQESFASNRGYIWARTLPLLRDNVFVGAGPDGYAAIFPQYDVKGKGNYLYTSAVLVSKPHNIYLQIATQSGLLSLLMLVIVVIASVFYVIKARKSEASLIAWGITAAIITFVVSGLANDSIIPSTSMMWILLALSFVELKIPSEAHKQWLEVNEG